jgi:DNA-directed RNA polymerase subunit E'/Rpb7
MYLEKLFDVTVDVRNPINFCADKERHLLAELRNTYLGRCFKGAYITRIKEIRHMSACRISSTNASGEGSIDVQFLAEVVVFSKWDILVGVRVASHQQMVAGSYEASGLPDQESGVKNARAAVILMASRAVETLAVGQLVPVRVFAVQHQPLQPQASVVGVLLACEKAAPVYRLRGRLDQSAKIELAPMLDVIDAELRAREVFIASRKPDLWFFELLLYGYRPSRAGQGSEATDQTIPTGVGADAPQWTGPGGLLPIEEGAEPQNVLEIVRRVVEGETVPVTGCWSRSLALYRSSPLAARAEEPPAGWQPPIDGTPRAVFAEFLKNILDFLAAVREMAELYNTRELIEQHRNVWAAVRAEQKVAPATKQ